MRLRLGGLVAWLCAYSMAVLAEPVVVSPAPPAVAARAWLLVDANSGRTLAEQQADSSVEPASLTKLMTAYLTFAAVRDQQLTLERRIPVSEAAISTRGAQMFLLPATPPTVDVLLHGLITVSANDAAVALAEAVAGSEAIFVQSMNREARRLGMNQTHFMNATGLPHPEHRTTARDLVRLTRALLRDFPQHYPRFAERAYTYNRITQSNRNALLWLDPHVDGLKTGHTATAGYALVASARRDNRRLISVLMGAATEAARTTDSLRLLNYGFANFETLRLYSARQGVASLEVFHGQRNRLEVGFLADFYVTVARGSGPLKAQVIRREPLLAPFRLGQTVATLRVTAGEQTVGDFPLQALAEMERAGFLGRLWDNLRLKYRQWSKR